MARDDFRRAAQDVLTRALGEDATFRPQQLEAIEGIVVDRGRLLVVQRTGWGKSAVYFVATRLLRDRGAGPTIIISPLLALMRDQIAMGTRLGLSARTINSSNRDDWDAVENALLRNEVDVLLISPERLNNIDFRERLLTPLARAAGLLVVDEAHCISDWGHDFRPGYRRLVRVLELMPQDMPILCTATANDRVNEDIGQQLGERLLTLRGSLDRKSLSLHVIHLDSPAERLAWLAENVPTLHGSGIVYCLTVADCERTAAWLRSRGIEAAAYTGDTDPAVRLEVERLLRVNELKAVVATSALGMGYDKPDLGFVIHFQSPDSPVAYYQRVGRAGRALPSADAVLLVGREDADIWRYFLETSLPLQADAEELVRVLAETADWTTLASLQSLINLKQSRIEGLLKVLEVENAVERQGRSWRRTLRPWRFDVERIERVRAARVAEQEAMRSYATVESCRMNYLQRELDDPANAACGRCDNCADTKFASNAPRSRVAEALEFVRHRPMSIEPRLRWPGEPVSGRIPEPARVESGRVLCARLAAEMGLLAFSRGFAQWSTSDEERRRRARPPRPRRPRRVARCCRRPRLKRTPVSRGPTQPLAVGPGDTPPRHVTEIMRCLKRYVFSNQEVAIQGDRPPDDKLACHRPTGPTRCTT